MFGDAIGSMIKFLFTLLLGDKDPTTGQMTNGIANGIAYNQLMFKSEWFSGSDIMNQMFSYFSIIDCLYSGFNICCERITSPRPISYF